MKKIQTIHQDFTQWKRKLDFYRDEITFFFKELNRVFDKDKISLQRMEFIDEYEAILDKKKDKLQKIYEAIQVAKKSISKGSSSEIIIEDHAHIAKKMDRFIDGYQKMKHQFRMYAAHND